MNLLLDTNVFLEVLLEREHADVCRRLFSEPPASNLFLSDFTLHSLGVYLFRGGRYDSFQELVADVVVTGAARVLFVPPRSMARVGEIARAHRLDFDDSYQATLAEAHDLVVVSLDADFDRSPRGRKTPYDALADE